MNKNAIKKFAIDARNKLIASVTDKAGMESLRMLVVSRLLRAWILKSIKPQQKQK